MVLGLVGPQFDSFQGAPFIDITIGNISDHL